MIPRILVPRDVRPLTGNEPAAPGKRRRSALDERIVVPNDLPVVPLDGTKTAIPSHVPLDVVSARTLVPRDLPVAPLRDVRALPEYLPLSVLENRIVVPRDVEPLAPAELAADRVFEVSGPLSANLLDVRDPDVITTGEVNLLDTPVDERKSGWQLTSGTASVIVHVLLIVLALFSGQLFPHHEPTQAEMDLARRQLGSFVYLPPEPSLSPRVAPRPPAPRVQVNPDLLRRIAPPRLVQPESAPAPEATQPNRTTLTAPPVVEPPLPEAPRPQPSVTVAPPVAPRSVNAPPAKPNFSLPNLSPGRALDQTLHSALENGGTGRGRGFAGRLSGRGGGAGSAGGQGQGQGQVGAGIEMLTPTEGVDFTSYFDRLLASLKANWYAIMPESAFLGDRGKVVTEFRILRNGNVPFPEPLMDRSSGKEPLDRAAMAAIRASSPFEPLPPAFSGPEIRLRITFLYNLPLDAQ